MKCKRLKEIHEESNSTDNAYITRSIWLDDDKDCDDVMIVTKSKMLIRMILGSYLQFGGTVSRERRGADGMVGGEFGQLVYSFPFLGLNCGVRHCAHFVPDFAISTCSSWPLLHVGRIVMLVQRRTKTACELMETLEMRFNQDKVR